MYRDRVQWTKIRRRILVDAVPIRQMVRETGINRKTIRKMLSNRLPPPYGPRLTATKGSQLQITKTRTVATPERRMSKQFELRSSAFEWMRLLLQGLIPLRDLQNQVGDLPDLSKLLDRIYCGGLSDRNRAMTVLTKHRGLSCHLGSKFLGITRHTYRRYIYIYVKKGFARLFARQTKSNRKFDNEQVTKVVFSVLHEPPSNYNINRTSWTLRDLSQVLAQKGCPVGVAVAGRIIKAAGYHWRKARIVLTSHDPDFSAKLDRVRLVLQSLGQDEAFFSIDEFGPFAVKAKSGTALTAPGEQRVVQQWQKSKGRLILTAALELSHNQVHHFFSERKNTVEMIRMLELLIDVYHDKRTIYLSWDAASWHVSKRLFQRIEQHNSSGKNPIVDTAPLPAGAQFLNVIESVFSGMARAIIHNSDYASVDSAKAAIGRYFAERNEHFKQHPRRAGNRIWGKERQPRVFSESNNCKDPMYR